ncbi:class I SAM-dependent methyltransferase [Amycolatopsis nalaikhensis]|uniref:Class I SAM-dependent methyltransferase n=1 Tax=Amycolatopsis nalaikhensis TaxID=715472 RepID=A0ABY8XCH8_9PSEU|nr:class I SAM-dependent methyltransferase [Amycolatopsis sp. 2-2]WIV52696.1 class I SAM-dependent methyltransferase [Amycolatopsis sp. 2-2]
MGLRDRFQAGLARQLGHPSGLRGRVVGTMLNRGNRRPVTAAVAALGLTGGETALDIGFGGGVGLALLVRDAGTVHGVEISTTMLARARRTFRREIAANRIRLHEGSITALPLEDGSIDAAMTTNTVYFVDDLDGAFAEVARVLKPGGTFVLGIGDPETMNRSPLFTEHGFRIRPVADVEAALGRAGLELRRHEKLGAGQIGFHLLVTAK